MSGGAGDEDPIADVQRWLQRAVVGLNLCPYAKAPLARGRVRFVLSQAEQPRALLRDLLAELRALAAAPVDQVETTVLVHPYALQDFEDYNDFLDVADAALQDLGLDGVIQIASFHPQYRFADTGPDDLGNFTNRSPHPLLHLLREDSVAAALGDEDPEAVSAAIVERNQATLQRLGLAGWQQLMNEPEAKP